MFQFDMYNRAWQIETYTMRHKFSNFHLTFKMQNGMKMKGNKIFNPLIFDALAIIMPNFHWNITFP